jgi:pimeloyl-ACP methyl ester carboxylesterase
LDERLARGDRLLVAYARSAEVIDLVDATVFDAVVVPTARAALTARQGPVLLEAADAEQVRRAHELGLDGVLLPAGDVPTDVRAAAQHVQATSGRFAALAADAWAATAAEAQEAFRAGARVVVCDVAAALARFRPPRPPARDSRRPALLMLPGMLGDASVWDAVAERVSDIAVPVPARIDLDDSVPEMAETVLAAAPERFYLCGHSLGGIVALEILRRSPERVVGTLLANTSARAASPEQQAVWSRWRERTAQGDFDAIAAELARSTLPAARRDEADLVRHNERMAHAVGAVGFARQLSAQITRPDSRGTLGGVDGATVVVVSCEDDQVCPPALQRELADCLRDARLVTITGCGHMLPLEDPDALAGVIREVVRAGALVQ